MGDLQRWPPAECNGHRNPSPLLSLPQHQANPPPSTIPGESWRHGEKATREIVRLIQPTAASEERRLAVIHYVRGIIGAYAGSEVFPFGSVPLKTYLPDGDIDLTAIGLPNLDDSLVAEVRSVLHAEEQNKNAEFEVKDLQYIHAEVKLVKCLVQNIVVDISFNQIGGLCTLCFLEKVDCLIGKENLFKRSIILIKAWCYYESRILGAHHGLISTYALETLVLYIFHLFHSSLHGPLAVLYRFLDYYSKFDWDNYCISLGGPVPVTSLPEIAAQPPELEGSDLLLTSKFLKSCTDNFSAPSRGLESRSRVFLQKHLNIVDPLKENNNLGRSVSKGNYYRIRSAFSYGARKLGRILLLPSGSIEEEINLFFMNTLDRHGSGERPDVQDSLSRFPNNREIDSNDDLAVVVVKEDRLNSSTADCLEKSCVEPNKIKISVSHKENDEGMDFGNHLPYHQSAARSKMNGLGGAGVVSGRRLAGDAHDLASNRDAQLRNLNVPVPFGSSSGNGESCGSLSGKAYHAPHLFYCYENGRGIGNTGSTIDVSGDSFTNRAHFNTGGLTGRRVLNAMSSLYEPIIPSGRSVFPLENPYFVDTSFSKNDNDRSNGISESQILLDLSGDFDMHSSNLQYAKWCQDYSELIPNHRPSLSEYVSKHSLDMFPGRNMFMNRLSGNLFPPAIYSVHPAFIPNGYAKDDRPKPRGTGLYFPNPNHRSYKDRQSTGRGRSSSLTSQPRPRNYSRPATPPEHEKVRHDTQEHQSPTHNDQVVRYHNNVASRSPPDNLASTDRHDAQGQSSTSAWNGQCKSDISNSNRTSRSGAKGIPLVVDCTPSPEGKVEFGTLGSYLRPNSARELSGKLDSVSTYRQACGHAVPSTVNQLGQKSVCDRPKQTYHLKDDIDFPPLTG